MTSVSHENNFLMVLFGKKCKKSLFFGFLRPKKKSEGETDLIFVFPVKSYPWGWSVGTVGPAVHGLSVPQKTLQNFQKRLRHGQPVHGRAHCPHTPPPGVTFRVDHENQVCFSVRPTFVLQKPCRALPQLNFSYETKDS